jgi:hypothetical protein
MTWVAWRQQRASAVAAAVLLAVGGLVLLASGWQVTASARDSGLAACVAAGGDCRVLAEAFASRYGPILEPVSTLGALLPVVLGVLVGAPLLAREFEQGTHRLAWTQSVTRGRWLAARLAVAAGPSTSPPSPGGPHARAPSPTRPVNQAPAPAWTTGCSQAATATGPAGTSPRRHWTRLCSGTAGRAVDRCLAANGIQRVDRHQPASRAWQLALTQFALYLVVAALFLALACWRTLRPD